MTQTLPSPFESLERLCELSEKATPGPWHREAKRPFWVNIVDGGNPPYPEPPYPGPPYLIAELGPHKTDKNTENGEFIVAARNSMSDLRALLKQHQDDHSRILSLETALREAIEWIQHADEDAWGYAGHDLPGGPWPLRNEVADKLSKLLPPEEGTKHAT